MGDDAMTHDNPGDLVLNPLMADVEDRELLVTIINPGPNRLQVAKILRSVGWSIDGVRILLGGAEVTMEATGLQTAHRLAAAGATVEVAEKVWRWDTAPLDLLGFRHDDFMVSNTVRMLGPGYTSSRREALADWARRL